MRGRNDSRYEQSETSSDTIEQELRPTVCEQRHRDKSKENYSIDGDWTTDSRNFTASLRDRRVSLQSKKPV